MRARRVGRRGRPTRVSLYVDARAVVRETTRGDGDDGDDDEEDATADETWKTFARRALARAVDGRRCEDVRFRASAFDWTTAPHAFEGAVRRGNAARGGGGDGFRACGRDAVARALVDVEDACVEYARAESGAMASRANAFVERRGALDAWMKNLTRYVGAAMVDFSEGGGFATAFADDDEDAGGESQGVLFIVVPLPEVTAEEMRTIDPERVAATFKRVEEQFERERVRAHLVYVGAPPTGVVARCLREVFRKLRGAVVPLDAATKIAAWTPLYSALSATTTAKAFVVWNRVTRRRARQRARWISSWKLAGRRLCVWARRTRWASATAATASCPSSVSLTGSTRRRRRSRRNRKPSCFSTIHPFERSWPCWL